MVWGSSSGVNGSGAVTDENGEFQASVRAGSNTVLTAYAWGGGSERFVAEPLVIAPYEDMEPLTITLREGIPVRGTVMYKNGMVAVGQSISFVQQVEPVLHADTMDENARRSLRSSRYSGTDTNGEYVVFLSPGDYTTNHHDGTITIAEGDAEHQLDLTLPTPVFIALELPDGSSPGMADLFFAGTSGGTLNTLNSRIDTDRRPYTLHHVDGTLYLHTTDGKHGTIETITPAMAGETVRITLKPMATGTITLVDADGKPMENATISVTLEIRHDRSTHSRRWNHSTTDSEGKAVLPLFPAKHTARITLPGSFEDENHLPSSGGLPFIGLKRLLNSIEREFDLSPGETIDFGTITIIETTPNANPVRVPCC